MNANKNWAEEKLVLSIKKVKEEIKHLNGGIPYVPENGRYKDSVEKRGIDWWTNGFFSGILWQLYHKSKEDIFKQTAIQQEERLDEALKNFRDIHHDVGFMWLHTSVANYRLTGNHQSRQTGLHAATLLAGRFNTEGNFLVAWNDEHPGWVIIDSMMNIPLLYWASRETKDPRFYQIANKHAQTIAKNLVRSDGSVAHIGSFNSETGEFIETIGGQGYSQDSAWSRGNAWGIYGFALSYRYTKNPEYLNLARRIAHFFIAQTDQTANIPLVDFKAPKEPEIYDTSAGLCAVCGLFEISQWVEENEKEFYYEAALKILRAIEVKYSNYDIKTDGIITGGTEAYHRPNTYNIPLIYTDYFFIEALLRITEGDFLIW